jgi:tetratricopeptide (TPR) repeat protein
MFWKRRKHGAESSAEQGHLHIATEATARAEWGHALVHLAAALESEPADSEALALLEQVLRSARDPLKQLPLSRKGETPYQIVAMLAYIHGWSGRLDEAVSIMTQVYQAVPGTPYLRWLLDWLSLPGCPDRVRPKNVAALISTMMTKFPGEPPAEGGDILKQLRPLFTHFWEAHQEASLLGSVLSILVRRLGHVDEAIAIARATYEAHPDYTVAASLAVAYVRKGDTKAAIEAYRCALEHDPSALDLRVDLGDLLCSTGQIKADVEMYRQVLDQEPDHDAALPSYFYFQQQLDPGGSWAEQLERYIVEHPDSPRARELCDYLDPYVSYLPEPSDATINLLRQVVRQEAGIEHFTIELSALESPSARRAVELYQQEQYGRVDLVVRVGEVQQPDPRLPHGPVDFVLWQYTGTDPRPTIGPPASPVAQAVASLAVQPFGAQTW